MSTKLSHRRLTLPIFLLSLGVLAGTATAIVAFTGPNSATAALGAITAVIAIWLTFMIAGRQDAEAAVLKEIVQRSEEMIREIKEQSSEQDYEGPASEADDEDELPTPTGGPSYRDEAIEALRAHHAPLDFDGLEWRAKEPLPALPGNHGWFVESPGLPSAGRWFVRKARGMTVRKAMPRDFLEALEQEAPIDPRRIKLDFQIKEHGLAAWYARTYGGELWKVWRANRNATAGVQVEKIESV
ncbi:hypothetical protein [Microbacterium suaedae]|uniref:hypothetical protein n=1 Tax=Microbacterium suaedae TaxID=2067813 RepID=UPI0013A67DD7|nr:hypothetical protein [Microbacterium suaedae]